MRLSQQQQASFHSFLCHKASSVTQASLGSEPDYPSQQGDTPISLRIIRSEDLLCGQTEILIRHGSEVYRLRVTRAGKLILTK